MSHPTLLESLKPVLGKSRRHVCLTAMNLIACSQGRSISASELKTALVAARVPKAKQFNVSDILGKAGDLVTADHNSRNIIWSLTKSGEAYVEEALGLKSTKPGVKNSFEGLSKLIGTISDSVVRGYVEESFTCYQVDARRAAVVFLWSGAIRYLQDKAMSFGVQALNTAIAKHDAKAKQLKKLEDFSYVKDVTQLLAFRELGIMDKGQWQTMQEGLDLRNRCGHPTRYTPGAAKVAAFIEDVIGIAF